MSVTIANTDSNLSGKTLDLLESDQTITGAKTFSRGASAPFVCVSGAAKVTYLDADKLDGQDGPSSDVVGISDSQTLTNKTITAPVLSGTVTGTYTLGGTPTIPASGLSGVVAAANLPSSITFDDVQAATGANTTETTLFSYTATGKLGTNGNTIRLSARGTFASNANVKTVRVRWNGLSGTVVVTNPYGANQTKWELVAVISRIGSNSQRLAGTIIISSSTGFAGNAVHEVGLTTDTVTDSGAMTLVVTGQNGTASASDIVYETALVETLSA